MPLLTRKVIEEITFRTEYSVPEEVYDPDMIDALAREAVSRDYPEEIDVSPSEGWEMVSFESTSGFILNGTATAKVVLRRVLEHSSKGVL